MMIYIQPYYTGLKVQFQLSYITVQQIWACNLQQWMADVSLVNAAQFLQRLDM